MGWNLGRALTNAVLILLLGAPLLRLLRRAARRAVFVPRRGYCRGHWRNRGCRGQVGGR